MANFAFITDTLSTRILDSASNTYNVGYRTMPQSTTSSGNIRLNDSGKHLYLTGSVTVANNSTVPFDVGTVLTIISNSSSVTITQGTGVTIRLANTSSTGSRTISSNGVATLVKVDTDLWYINGTGVT
jgi:hypothetical protein